MGGAEKMILLNVNNELQMYYIYSHVTCRSLVRRNLHFATLKIRYIILCMMNSIFLDLHEPENMTCSTLSENRACQNFTTENIQLSSDPDYQRRIPDPCQTRASVSKLNSMCVL